MELSRIGVQESRARRLVEERYGPVSGLALEVEPFQGGLESAAVARVTARFRSRHGRRMWRWVVKRIDPGGERELAIYRELAVGDGAAFLPALLGVDPLGEGGAILHLEWVRPVRAWPWRESRVTATAMRRFARVHEILEARLRGTELPGWDYGSELGESAAATLYHLYALPREDDLQPFRRLRRAVHRIYDDLPRIRREVAAWDDAVPWIHGDLHPGNVVVRRRNGRPEPVLLDWSRARRGSSLEDLSSWMLSLAHWEPVAARRHDTLLREYLRSAGREARLCTGFRDAYWLAAGCNALAGVLRFHVTAAVSAPSGRHRRAHLSAARPWARAIRQADRRWRGTA